MTIQSHDNRGRHPLIWALVFGLKETASTFFFIVEGADLGSLMSQRKISIEPMDNADRLFTRLPKVILIHRCVRFPTGKCTVPKSIARSQQGKCLKETRGGPMALFIGAWQPNRSIVWCAVLSDIKGGWSRRPDPILVINLLCENFCTTALGSGP